MNHIVHVDFYLLNVFYDNIRRTLFVILRIYDKIDLNVILYGNTELSIDKKKKEILRVVQVFLKDSKITTDFVNHAGLNSIFRLYLFFVDISSFH